MQRLASDDLVGHIIEQGGDEYVKLILPNEFESKNKCSTYINGELFFEDPRTEEGELLSPALLSAEQTETLKSRMLSADYLAQYMHRPVPLGGNKFKTSYFQYWERTTLPYCINLKSRFGESHNQIIRTDRCSRFLSCDFATQWTSSGLRSLSEMSSAFSFSCL